MQKEVDNILVEIPEALPARVGPIQICCIGIDGKDAEGTFLGGFQEKEVLAVVGTADIQLGRQPSASAPD